MATNLRLPDFIIGGAARSGTTWLYELLALHPRVYMARPVRPEPKFFLVDEQYARGLQYYGHWFADASTGQVAGEKSTNYMESPVAAGRIRADLPDVKLVFILRDPVERAYSNYLWSRMSGLETESFTSALALETEREKTLPAALRYARPFRYFSRGLYADLLEPWLALFPHDRILVLRYEDIEENRPSLVATLANFLGIAPRFEDALVPGVVNAADRIDTKMPPDARRYLTAAYAEPNRRLARLLGDRFKVWESASV